MSLLKRTIRSVGRRAYTCAAPLMGSLESQLIPVESGSHAAPIFIIGAPRTGSTILYQAITNYFDVIYIDNLACRFYRHLRLGIWLSRVLYGSAPHHNFKSEHGSTAQFGGHAPSECGGFWYRWLPKNRHFIDDSEISDRVVEEIRAELSAVYKRFRLPIVIKNLNAGQRLRLIRRCFPDAKFIYIKRDFQAVAASILAGRRRVGVGQGEWWGIKPRNFEELMLLPEREMVFAQVRAIEEQIDLDLKRFAPANQRTVQYESLDAGTVLALGEWLGLVPRKNGALPDFARRNVTR